MKFFVTPCIAAFGLLSALAASHTAAEILEQAQLQDLTLDFAPIEVVSQRPGRSQLMRVDTLPDDRLQLRLPFRPNQLTRLVGDGSEVSAGQAVAEVRGAELAQWLLEARLTRERYAAARTRYLNNRPLFEKQALSAERWQAIADRYLALQVDMHHVEHVLEWLRPNAESESAARLVVPASGLLLFATLPETAEGELPIVELLDVAALRLSARLPTALADSAIALHSGDCQLGVESREGRFSGLSRQLWSAALKGCRHAHPGQPVEGYPVFSFDGYRVPRAAVMRHDGRTLLALARGADLELRDVVIAGEDAQGFYLRAGESLVGERVLVRSVSAVQGMLLGLGGE